MVNESRSWIVLGVAVATVGLGAWLLRDRESIPAHSPTPPSPASAATAQRVAAVPPPVATVPASSASAVAPAIAPDRFRLLGVTKQGGERLAMISLDGQPARAFRVGEVVGGEMVLRQVSAQSATIGPRDGGASIALQGAPLPPPAAADVAAPNLAERSVESDRALQQLGARHYPKAPPMEAEPASAPQEASAPADPGRWRPTGQP